ncbi:mitochondrial ATP synthase [Neoconidiobolus thromboides FSU 785]|nr:mitochondrial ATP synthase [Neoconidiobolus thromboides FSU 785]
MSAISRINWSKLSGALASRQNTQGALINFRKQYDDVKRQLAQLEEQKVNVDFAHYRKLLKNQKVVDQLESTLKKFKPVAYNLQAQQKVIEAFETKAIQKAEETNAQIENEVASLKETLKNIESARPVDELSVEDVTTAIPEIDQRVEQRLINGQWTVPGYSDRVGNTAFF